MVHVLSSPENAGGFFRAGSMDWGRRTQNVVRARFPRLWAFALASLRIVAFRGIVPLKQSLNFASEEHAVSFRGGIRGRVRTADCLLLSAARLLVLRDGPDSR